MQAVIDPQTGVTCLVPDDWQPEPEPWPEMVPVTVFPEMGMIMDQRMLDAMHDPRLTKFDPQTTALLVLIKLNIETGETALALDCWDAAIDRLAELMSRGQG